MENHRKLFLSVLVAGLLIGLIGATQFIGWAYAYDPRLGFAIVRMDGIAIYWPFAFIVWTMRLYYNSQNVINYAGLIFVGCMMFPFILAVIITKQGTKEVAAFGADRWGKVLDAKRAGIFAKKAVGVILGFWEQPARILSFNGPEHQLVAGASRAGKGAGHVVPTLLTWGESAIVYDPKGECYDITAAFRAKFSHAFYVNFCREDSACFNPLAEVRPGFREIGDIQNIVKILSDPAGNKDSPNFFDLTASALLTAIILHQLYAAPDNEKNLSEIRFRLLNIRPLLTEMSLCLHRYKRDRKQPDGFARDKDGKQIPEAVREVRGAAIRFLAMPEKLLGDIAETATSYLDVYADELVAEKTSRSDFKVGDLVCSDHPVTFYLQTPPADEERLRPLTRLLLSQFARSLMHSPTKDVDGRLKKHRLLFQIDEFPSLGKLGFFSANLRVMAGYGLKAHLTVQSFKDIIGAYGPHNTILDNMHITVAFAAADDESGTKISNLTGKGRENRESRTRNSGVKMFAGSQSTTRSEQLGNLLEAGDVRSLPYDEQLIFVTGAKPFRTKKIRYWEMAPFKDRATDIKRGGVGPDQEARLDVPKSAVSAWAGVKPVGMETADHDIAAGSVEPATLENAIDIVKATGLNPKDFIDDDYGLEPDSDGGPDR